MEKNRVSTPVRKARKESVMFVSPELEDQHILDDDMAEGTVTKHAYIMSTKSTNRRRAAQPDIRLTMTDLDKLSIAQWNKLAAYWEHETFVRLRYAGIVLCFVAFICGLISIPTEKWVEYKGECHRARLFSDEFFDLKLTANRLVLLAREFHYMMRENQLSVH